MYLNPITPVNSPMLPYVYNPTSLGIAIRQFSGRRNLQTAILHVLLQKEKAKVNTYFKLQNKTVEKLQFEKEQLQLELRKQKRRPSRTVGILLFISGSTALVFSLIYASTILAFIGLGLTFWGALLLYITPKKYVKHSLLYSTAFPSLFSIAELIDSSGYKGKGIYLPPRHLKELKGGKVFIPQKNEVFIPSTEELEENKFFIMDPKGICLTPPGLDLVNLFEKELRKDFAGAEIQYLQNNLPKLLIEDLEIAEDIEITVDGNVIRTKIVRSIYEDFCRELVKTKKVCSTLGCPLCSSIACALARTTGKPVIIKENAYSKDTHSIEVHYMLIEE